MYRMGHKTTLSLCYLKTCLVASPLTVEVTETMSKDV